MVSMPKTPFSWGDDLNDVQVNPNPSMDAPVTVTDPGSLSKPIGPVALAPSIHEMHQGDAPDPDEYAKMGEMARRIGEDQYDPDGNSGLAGLGYWAGQSLRFKRGDVLDAQRYGATPPYANYVFGVYNAASGTDLPLTLDLANVYGKYRATYNRDKTKMDEIYGSIPAENVQNITKGYNDYLKGTLWRKPQGGN